MSGGIRVDAQAPDFELRAVDGASVGGRSLRGRPVLLVFLRHLY